MAGDGTNVGEIIAYLRLNRSDWDREIAAAQRSADQLGRSSPDVRIQTNADRIIADLRTAQRSADALGRSDPDIRIDTNAARVVGELQLVQAQTDRVGKGTDKLNVKFHAIADSLLLLGPAALPIAAVAGGALLGLVPVAASVVLGIKGISDEYKSGALAGTAYGRDINTLKGELQALKQTAAAGLLPGIDKGVQQSRPLFRELNGDIGLMSHQIGDIVGNGAPALLHILTQLNPLFVTFGNLIARGAGELEHWAASSDGVSHFVAAVQGELPTVMSFLGNLIVLISHLAQAGAGFGSGILIGLNTLVALLDQIPIGTLQVLIPLIIATRVGFLSWKAISGVVNSVTSSIDKMGARSQAAALQVNASALQQQAAQARLAAQTAETNAANAASYATTQRQIALSLLGTNSVLADQAATESAAAGQFAAAEQEKAAAAQAAALRIQAAATEQAAAAEGAAGAVTGAGASAAIPVVGALAVGLGVLGAAFLSSSGDSKVATDAMSAYADATKHTLDTTTAAYAKITNQQLGSAHAFDLLDELHSKNQLLDLDYGDLTKAILGPKAGFDALNGKLLDNARNIGGPVASANGKLSEALEGVHNGLQQQINAQRQYNQAQRESRSSNNSAATAEQARAQSLHTTTSALQAAQAAARKNAESTREETVQMQLANDAAGLLAAALDKLSGKKLSFAQSQNAFDQAIVSFREQTKKAKAGLDGMSKSAVQNRGNLLGLVQDAEQTAEAYGNMNHSTEAGKQKLIELRKQIIDTAVAQGMGRKEAAAFVDSILKIGKLNPKPTKLDVEKDQADAKIKDLRQEIDNIKQGKVVGLDADPAKARKAIAIAQAEIDALKQKRPPAITVTDNATTVVGKIQAAIEALRDRTITITAYEHIVGIDTAAAQDHRPGQGGNRGGAVGSSAAWGRADGTIPPNTVGSVGERGAEGFATDSQGRVRIFSHADSVAMGMPPQGYAAGSGGPSTDPTQILKIKGGFELQGQFYKTLKDAKQALADWQHQLEASRAYMSKEDERQRQQQMRGVVSGLIGNIGTTPSPQIDVASTGIDRIRAQIAKAMAKLKQEEANGLGDAAAARLRKQIEHLQKEAERQLGDLRVKIHHGDLDAIGKALKGTADDVRQAFAQLLTDEKAAGASAGILDKIRDRERDLLTVQRQLGQARTQLANEKDYRSGIESTLAGQQDFTKAGSIGDLLAQLGGATKSNDSYKANVDKLEGEAKGNKRFEKFIHQLEQQGDTTTLATLAAGSKGDIAQVMRAVGKYDTSLTGAGNAATTTKFGKSVDQQQKAIDKLVRHQGHLMDRLDHLTDAMSKPHKSKASFMVHGNVLGELVVETPAFVNAFDELATTITHGHRKGH